MQNNFTEKYLKQIKQVEKTQPKLKYHENTNCFCGVLILYDNEHEVIDEYSVEIDLKPFPNEFPIVKEVGERIPRKDDRHVYQNGACCLTTKPKEQILIRKFIKTIPQFIDEIVVKFFLNNSYFEYSGEYKNGAYSHGIIGILESYADIANIKNVALLEYILKARLINYKFERNEKCFCNSGKKFKNCHIRQYADLQLIDKDLIASDMLNFKKLQNLLTK